MRQLLDLLDGGTRETLTEPVRGLDASLSEMSRAQQLSCIGTIGTRRTLANSPTAILSDLSCVAAHVVDLADIYAERMAICLEAGDISEVESETTAALEAGRALVRLLRVQRPDLK